MKLQGLERRWQVYYSQYVTGIFGGPGQSRIATGFLARRMRIRKTLKGFDKGRDVTLLFSSVSSGNVRGKYLVGMHASEADHFVIVFDESASFHRDIALGHRIRPRGGGWLELVAASMKIQLSGRSQAYGREPDRELTRRVLSIAFPEYSCTIES